MAWTIEEEKLSRFAKIIQFSSKINILPFSVDYAKSKITFSYLDNKTLIHVFLTNIPFLVVYFWIFLQLEFYTDLLEALQIVYLKSDLLTMIIFPGTLWTPFGITSQNLVFFSAWCQAQSNAE